MELMSLIQAAEVVGCHPRTLREAAQEGRLEAKKFAHSWLVTREALEDWRSQYWMIGRSVPRNRRKTVPTP